MTYDEVAKLQQAAEAAIAKPYEAYSMSSDFSQLASPAAVRYLCKLAIEQTEEIERLRLGNATRKLNGGVA